MERPLTRRSTPRSISRRCNPSVLFCWCRCFLDDLLTFGAARLTILLRFAATVSAAGAALFIGLDATIELLMPGAHNHGDDEANTEVAVPWAAAVASSLAAILSIVLGGNTALQSDAKPPPQRRLLRIGMLALCAWLGAAPLDSPSWHAATWSNGKAGRHLAMPPSFLRTLLEAFLRRPDASAGTMLCLLAVSRGCREAYPSARLLLQASPPRTLIPDLPDRLARARATPGVSAIRDVRLWMLDEETATGSLVVLAEGHADVQMVRKHVRRAVEGAPLIELTVMLERDEDAPPAAEWIAEAEEQEKREEAAAAWEEMVTSRLTVDCEDGGGRA